jgi:RHS repeat-associated protein
VAVVDLTSLTLVGTIATGTNPLGVAMNAAGSKAYVTLSGSNTVAEIDVATNAVNYTYTVGQGPTSVGGFVAGPANQPPSVALTSPANNTNAIAPATVTLTATATDSDGAIGKVDFYNGATLLGSVTTGSAGNSGSTYTLTLTNVPAGSYGYAAKATDDEGAMSLSAPVISVTVANPPTAKVYYVHADHLGTPRTITDPATNNKVWEWRNDDPFFVNPPNQNPGGLGVFVYNLRGSWQYYDIETGTHYNTYRDYDPALDRYLQSDPIGLRGGINTYVYVEGDSLGKVDLLGLLSAQVRNCVCKNMQASNYVASMAWSASLKERKEKIRGYSKWYDPVLRQCENYLYAYASVVDYGDSPTKVRAEVKAQALLKYVKDDTTASSREAEEAGYEGVNDGANKKDWKKECDGCKKNSN